MTIMPTDIVPARPCGRSGGFPDLDSDASIAALKPLEPAAAASPAWLAPQRRHFGVAHTAFHNRLGPIGYFPVSRQTFRFGWPCPVLASWTTPLTFAGTPLVDERYAGEAIEAFLTTDGVAAFVLNGIAADGPFWDSLSSAAKTLDAPVQILSSWQRAALRPNSSFDAWFEANFERKRRKEFRRLRARLAEQGRLDLQVFGPGHSLKAWTDELLALEAKGWKGRRGTALAANPQAAFCLQDCLTNLKTERQLRFWKLALDDRPVAMMFAVVQDGQAWLGKIAYDEDLSKYSPGVLLVLDATEKLMAEPAIRLVDSCAIPNHPMIDHLWRDRIGMCDVLIGRPGTSPALFNAMSLAERTRRTAYAGARELFHRITKRHRS